MIGSAPCDQCGHYEDDIPLTGEIIPDGDNLMYKIEAGFNCKVCGMVCTFMTVSDGTALANSLFEKAVRVE